MNRLLKRGVDALTVAFLAGHSDPSTLAKFYARVAVHRLKRRYGAVLRRQIADTVWSETEVDDELRLSAAMADAPWNVFAPSPDQLPGQLAGFVARSSGGVNGATDAAESRCCRQSPAGRLSPPIRHIPYARPLAAGTRPATISLREPPVISTAGFSAVSFNSGSIQTARDKSTLRVTSTPRAVWIEPITLYSVWCSHS
jgi:hypothetical protein